MGAGGPTKSQIRHLLLKSTTSSINRSCTLISGTFLLRSTTLHSSYLCINYQCMMFFCKKCSPLRSFCHLHLSMLGVYRCCKRQTIFKCHKSQTECLECSKTPGRRWGTQPLLSALREKISATGTYTIQASQFVLIH